ncbi:uncharacterized protein LOC114746442 [Neltuma alba]|uniref:uncharacterized protein LOC114746442 n=1 Tax=Neltuma alba TaxID=207710 RepID=UPI0010A396E8|nr:uncharacterized protein LOC114746442 [Prosopis alba]
MRMISVENYFSWQSLCIKMNSSLARILTTNIAAGCAAEVKSYHTAHPSSEHITVAAGSGSAPPEITIHCVETASLSSIQSSPALTKSDNLTTGSGGRLQLQLAPQPAERSLFTRARQT